jgi:cell division protein FtsL
VTEMHKKNAFLWLIYVSILFLVVITQKMERIKTGRSIAYENALISEKKARNDYLEFLLAKSKSYKYLIAQAKKRLNLDTPKPDRVYVLESIETSKQYDGSDTLVAKLFSPK